MGIIPHMKRPVLLLILITILLCGVMFVVIQKTPPPSPPPAVYEISFSTPGQPDAQRMEQQLCDWIANTQRHLDIAAFDIDLPCVGEQLTRLHQKGVALRIVTDSDHDTDLIQKLKPLGIPIHFDERSAFMHNKFLIQDQKRVWTGSLNLTHNGVYRNNNNVVRIANEDVARLFTAEFEELFAGAFGPTSPRQALPAFVAPQGHKMEVLFSPEDPVQERVLDILRGAQKHIVFMAFSFTDDAMGKVLAEKAAAGVLVQGVFERSGAGSKYSEYGRLKRAGADVKKDGNKGIMHHKVMIVDDNTVITGSYNFSKNANKSNDENVVILHDNPDAARLYLQEFQQVYALAK